MRSRRGSRLTKNFGDMRLACELPKQGKLNAMVVRFVSSAAMRDAGRAKSAGFACIGITRAHFARMRGTYRIVRFL
jgi:hypothetical protein